MFELVDLEWIDRPYVVDTMWPIDRRDGNWNR